MRTFVSSFAVSIALLSSTVHGQQPKAATKPVPQRKASVRPASPTASIPEETQSDPLLGHYRAAETFQLADDLKNAEAEYRRVISLALQRLAALRVIAQDDPQALRLLQAATAADPSDVDAQISLASVSFRSGDLASAKQILQSVLAKDDHQFRAKDLLGKVYFLDGDYEAAVAQLESAVKEGSSADSAYTLALAYLKLNKISNADVTFDEMLTSMGSSPELHVLIGRAYREGGQYDLAAQEFRKALSTDPNVLRAHSYLGITYLLQRGDAAFADAQQEFQAELAHNPKDFSSHFYLGAIHLKRREYAGAEQELAAAIRLDPGSADAQLYLGEAETENGKPQSAIVHLRDAVRLYGSNSRAARHAHEVLSQALKELGKTADAEKEAEIAQRSKGPGESSKSVILNATSSGDELRALLIPTLPQSTEQKVPESYLAGLKDALGNAYHNIGVIHAQQKDYAEAITYFAEASKWSPKITALDRNWGTAGFRANQFKIAIDPLARYLQTKPDDASARQMLALSYFMTEDFKKAAETFRPILAQLPNNPSLLYAAGVSFAKSGDANRATEMFHRMLVQDPNSAEVHLFQGQAYADLKKDTEALNEFKRAVELNPKLPGANSGAGLAHLQAGDLEQAEKSFRAELAVTPGDVSAEYWLGHVLLTEQKQGEAIALLNDVTRRRPDNGDAHYELGKALLERGELKPATERLEAAIRLQPDPRFAYYQLSLAYRRQGRIQEADAMLREYEMRKRKKP